MSNIDILKKCKEHYQYYSPFIDKCITILQFSDDDATKNKLKSKIEDINSMSELIKHFWMEEQEKFRGGLLEVLVTYRRKLRLE